MLYEPKSAKIEKMKKKFDVDELSHNVFKIQKRLLTSTRGVKIGEEFKKNYLFFG